MESISDSKEKEKGRVQRVLSGKERGGMKKANLTLGKKYLHRRRTVIAGIPRQAERWLRCERITPTGAVFSRDFEPEIVLTDKEIEEELMKGWEK